MKYSRLSLTIPFSVVIIIVITLYAFLSIISSVPAQGVNNVNRANTVHLNSRVLHVPADRLDALRALTDIPDGSSRRVLLQLKRNLNADERKSLEGSGIRLLQFVRNRGWYASVEGGIDETSPLLKDIRGSWDIVPEDKISQKLRSGNVPKYDVDNPGYIQVKIIPFPDADPDVLKNEIIGLGGIVDSHIKSFNILFASVPKHAVHSLAALDDVQWISPAAQKLMPQMDRARAFLKNDNVQDSPYDLTGAGVEVSIHDAGHALEHNDLAGRWIQGDAGAGEPLNTSGFGGEHATATAGTIAGDGSSWPSNYNGMAPGAAVVT